MIFLLQHGCFVMTPPDHAIGWPKSPVLANRHHVLPAPVVRSWSVIHSRDGQMKTDGKPGNIVHARGFLRLAVATLAVAASLSTCTNLALGVDLQDDCGPLTNHFGPFNYRDPNFKAERPLVENAHFTPDVERLKAGSTGPIAGDISYTLKVFPNHPRALMSMANLALREKKDKPLYSAYSMSCWLQRAKRFAPEDPQVYAVEGYYLSKLGRKQEAVVAFETAIGMGQESMNTYYNLALVQVDLMNFDDALKNAKKAYELGAPLPGLRDKLRKAGKWVDD